MTKTKTLDPTDVATQVEKASQNGGDPSIVTMSTGIQFKVRPVSKHALASISERYSKRKPQVPILHIESKGRKEPNYDDPDYQDALYSWTVSLSMAVNNYLLLRGADLIEDTIPENTTRHDSSEWQEEMEIIGSNPDNSRACYLEWIKIVAAPENEYISKDGKTIRGDIPKLLYAIGRASGTAVEDVDEAVDNFQR